MRGFNIPTRFPPELLAQIAAAGFKPPQAMNMPGLNVPTGPPPSPGLNVGDAMAGLGMALGMMRGGDPGAVAQREAIANDAVVQANPATSAAGMLAGTNPDAGIGGGMPAPPDGSSGVGTSPYGAPDFLTGIWRKLFG